MNSYFRDQLLCEWDDQPQKILRSVNTMQTVPPAPRKPEAKYLTFAFTLSLKNRGGIADDSPEAIGLCRWLGKSRAGLAISECHPGTSLRHIHGAVWLKVASTRGDVEKRIHSIKAIKDLQLTVAEKKHALLVKIMYNSDWHDGYCVKSPDKTILHDSLPIHHGEVDLESLEEDYPEKDDTRAKHEFSGDPRYLRLESMYYETVADKRWTHVGHDMETCRAWLMTAMYCWRIINVISDRRRLNQMSWSLMYFIDCMPHQAEYDTTTIDAMIDSIT